MTASDWVHPGYKWVVGGRGRGGRAKRCGRKVCGGLWHSWAMWLDDIDLHFCPAHPTPSGCRRHILTRCCLWLLRHFLILLLPLSGIPDRPFKASKSGLRKVFTLQAISRTRRTPSRPPFHTHTPYHRFFYSTGFLISQLYFQATIGSQFLRTGHCTMKYRENEETMKETPFSTPLFSSNILVQTPTPTPKRVYRDTQKPSPTNV